MDRKLLLSFFLVLVIFPSVAERRVEAAGKQGAKNRAARQSEEQEDYFKKWLTEDVFYIIAPEEKAVFQQLSTTEEKEQFIEQFWFRRDPNPATPTNEFKEEHYRRIAYANEHFASGMPGWLTDRGRIYIIHGPPAEIETHPSGGTYNRPFNEGGGTTATYPFEVWRYRYVERLGNDVVLEFVDPTLSGEYRLALNPEEKDALLHIPGAGLTLAESLGMATKADRPYFTPGNTNYPLRSTRIKDSPFERYNTYTQIQRPEELKYKDLKDIVKVELNYNNLPFTVRKDYFRLNQDRFLVPVTVEIQNKDLTFKQENNRQVAKVAVYGIVTSITNRIVSEFEDDLAKSFPIHQFQEGLSGSSIYQKTLLLDGKRRYKIDLVLKDLRSGSVGVLRQAIAPPSSQEDRLAASSLILAAFVRQLKTVPKEDQMFVLGDVWIRPNLSKVFSKGDKLSVYLQLYNAGADQATLAPSLSLRYRILGEDGRTVVEEEDKTGQSIQFFSVQRVVLLKQFALDHLAPGKYRLQLEARDLIKQESISTGDRFEVKANPSSLALSR
ncbi:MAG: GWxTD domain-containing protein [Acidobacteriota bacterium]